MRGNTNKISCPAGSWLIGAVIGFVALVMLLALGGWSFLWALLAALLLGGGIAALLQWILCTPLPAHDWGQGGEPAITDAQERAGYVAPAAPIAEAAPAITERDGPDAAEPDVPVAAGVNAGETASADDAERAAHVVASSASGDAAVRDGAVSIAELDGPDASNAPAPITAITDAQERAGYVAPAAPIAKAAPGITERDGPDAAEPDVPVAAGVNAGETASADDAERAAHVVAPDYDGDGVYEGADEGSRPQALSGPREGGADDLKQIKGIGPRLEALCHELGFYHFDQIAAWSDQEIAWVNANLEGFKGRVSRDNWVPQARILASGEQTEFSRRVDDGEVY